MLVVKALRLARMINVAKSQMKSNKETLAREQGMSLRMRTKAFAAMA